MIPEGFGSPENFLLPGFSRRPIENDQMPLVRRAAVHVGGGLFEAGGKGFLQAFVQYFQFEDDFLDTRRMRPFHEEVRPPPTQAVFP